VILIHETINVSFLEYKAEYGGDWPLTEKEMSSLDTNQESLVDLMDCSDLLVRLFSANVINGRQRETISSEPTNHRRNEVLLDILRKRSIDDYRSDVSTTTWSDVSTNQIKVTLPRYYSKVEVGSALHMHV